MALKLFKSTIEILTHAWQPSSSVSDVHFPLPCFKLFRYWAAWKWLRVIFFFMSRFKWKCIKPLYSDGFFSLIWYNKFGIVYCTYLGVLGYNFQNILFCFVWRSFYLRKQCRPWWNATLCSISSESSLLVKVPVYGFPVHKGLIFKKKQKKHKYIWSGNTLFPPLKINK